MTKHDAWELGRTKKTDPARLQAALDALGGE